MKFSPFLFLALIGYLPLAAQQTEGYVRYEVSIDSLYTDAKAGALYSGSSFEIYFNADFSRTDMSIGRMASFSCRVNYLDSSYLLMTSGLLGKTAVSSTIENVNQYLSDTESYMVARSSDTKVIQGYTCSKFILRSRKGVDLVYWTTKEIQAKLHGQSSVHYDMEGFPLQFEIDSDGLKLIFVANQIEQSLPDKDGIFDMNVPEGYERQSESDFFQKKISTNTSNND